jgi:spore germination cell wall hydrolase CwlJ-like protein
VIAVVGSCLLLRPADWLDRNDPARRTHPLTLDEARTINAGIPFVAGPLRSGRPFEFRGSPAAKRQATDCLATAALYEAGYDQRGQKAVIQVVLNRARHPGFPKTICGVVYQGSSRRTGCQFTFTCDGSFRRRQVKAGWGTARETARRALDGYVFPPVGTATHYHTDWVVPYWSGSLDKIAKVNTHIFYRSRGLSGRL